LWAVSSKWIVEILKSNASGALKISYERKRLIIAVVLLPIITNHHLLSHNYTPTVGVLYILKNSEWSRFYTPKFLQLVSKSNFLPLFRALSRIFHL
jgi:hypothetical protein